MTDTNSRVVEAIIGGDIDAFDVVVESGIDPSFVTDSDHWNYLHRALKSVTAQPTPAIVKRLIELGVDPSAQDR
ncbi:MAG: hypothetical protein NXI04_26290, partial [Planctomycetaceae bacterium]|nr:hypothetical protein [Planctomycetaceae bacterium]